MGRQESLAVSSHGCGPPARTTPERHARFAPWSERWGCSGMLLVAEDSDGGWESGQVLERDLRIGQGVDIDDGPRADELLDRLCDLPDVGVHASDHPASGEPEGDELPVGKAAANDEPI